MRPRQGIWSIRRRESSCGLIASTRRTLRGSSTAPSTMVRRIGFPVTKRQGNGSVLPLRNLDGPDRGGYAMLIDHLEQRSRQYQQNAAVGLD